MDEELGWLWISAKPKENGLLGPHFRFGSAVSANEVRGLTMRHKPDPGNGPALSGQTDLDPHCRHRTR